MDMQGEYVADKDRYAFLLGSALRNDDSEQFFCIYDSIIPKDLAEVQLEKIKEEARAIAELPEDDFNELVLNARSFSLARGRLQNTEASAMSTRVQDVLDDHSDDDGRLCCPARVAKLDLEPHSSLPIHGGYSSGLMDNDSGLPSSTKTGRRTSLSSDDDTGDMEDKGHGEPPPMVCLGMRKKEEEEDREERRSIRLRVGESVVVSHTYKPHYDEEVEVENDNESLESPRSDDSSRNEYEFAHMDGEEKLPHEEHGTEMTTFSSHHYRRYEEDEHRGWNIHQKLYGRRAASTSPIPFAHSAGYLSKGTPISGLRGSGGSTKTSSVDESVSFFAPPFGSGANLLENIGNSVNSLVKSSSYNLSKADTDSDGLMGDGKKKKKKRKDGRDNEGERKDVNGNPVTTIDPASYSQMRKPPRQHESSQVSGSGGQGPSGTPNHDSSSGRQDPSELAKDDPTSSPGSSSTGQTDKRKSKKGTRQPEKDIHAEEYEGYVGHTKDIDCLVKFINKEISQKTLKKITQNQNSDTKSPAAGASKSQKKTKQGSRTKQFQTTGVGENSEDSLTPASETTLLLSTSSLTSSYSSLREHHHTDLANKLAYSATATLDAEVHKEMGNSYSSREPGNTEDGASQVSLNSCEIGPADESGMPSSPVEKVKPDVILNHMHTSTSKLTVSSKQDQCGEIKEKGKAKSVNKDSNKMESQSTDSKKTKSKPTKNGVKPQAVSQKPSTTKKDSKADDWKVTSPKESHSMTSSSPPQTAEDQLSVDGAGIYHSSDIPSALGAQETWHTVPKKKKRSPTQPNQVQSASTLPFPQQHPRSKDIPVPSSSPSFSSSQFFEPSSRGGQRENVYRPAAVKPRSSTPPPYLKAAGPQTVEDKQRDLSPTDFPVLNTSPRDRRRSLENIFDTGQLICDKDSDKESCKSLPADKGLGIRSTASNYPVSYATMASSKTPRESIDSSKAESVSSSMEEANLEQFPSVATSPMKWKGSPQERRHSIGSAPEELSKATSGGSLQRTGSQEMLPRDKDCATPSASVPLSGTGVLVQSDSAGSFTGSDADSARGSEAGSETIVEVFTSARSVPQSSVAAEVKTGTATAENAAEAVSLDKRTEVFPVTESITIPLESESSGLPTVNCTAGNQPPQQTVANVPAKVTKPLKSRPVACRTDSDLTKQGCTILVEPVNNGHKIRKGVVFCDKRSDKDSCPIQGLSFGFFGHETEENSSVSFNCLVSDPSCVPQPPSAGVDDLSQSTLVSEAKDNVPSSSDSNPCSTQPSTPAARVGSSSSDNNPKPAKGPHIAGLNGLVSPQRSDSNAALVLQTSSTVPSTMSSNPGHNPGQTISVSSRAEDSPPEVQAVQSACDSVSSNLGPTEGNDLPAVQVAGEETGDQSMDIPRNGVLFTYGERVKGGKPKQAVFINPEETVTSSEEFIRCTVDAVSFLKKEWNKMMKQRQKDASSVVEYNPEN